MGANRLTDLPDNPPPRALSQAESTAPLIQSVRYGYMVTPYLLQGHTVHGGRRASSGEQWASSGGTAG